MRGRCLGGSSRSLLQVKGIQIVGRLGIVGQVGAFGLRRMFGS